jgi:hypothetical protein
MQLEHQRKNPCGLAKRAPARPLFLVSMSNSGGEGKTLLALLLVAFLCLEEEAVRVFDADMGNWSIRQQTNDTKSIGWGVQTLMAGTIADTAIGAHAVLDLGANALASATEIAKMVPELQTVFAERGYQGIAFIPVSTNKTGAVGAALALSESRDLEGFRKIFVRVDRDGSASFDAEIGGQEVVDLGHLSTGFQQYFRGPGDGLVNAILDPPAGFREASLHVAAWMRDFAEQDQISALFPRAVDVLRSLPEPTHELRMTVPDLVHAKDKSLAFNGRRTKIINLLDQHGWTPDGLRMAAESIGVGE